MGWQTAKVDRAQLRPAVGFENWSPDPSDIRALRRAERNLIDNNVEDLRDEAPPDDEPIVPEFSHFEDDQWFQEKVPRELLAEGHCPKVVMRSMSEWRCLRLRVRGGQDCRPG